MSNIENICQSVGILDAGKVIFSGKVNELLENVSGKVWECYVPEDEIENIKNICKVIYAKYDYDDLKVRYIS